ncbi:MAG: endonuclease/exonuclease/phosphatase family protein [Pirellulales bacterium]
MLPQAHAVTQREVLTLLIPFVKKRWLTLASVVGFAGYILNNYNVRGLEGLYLEPKQPTVATGNYSLPPLPSGPMLGGLPSTGSMTGGSLTSYPSTNAQPLSGTLNQNGTLNPYLPAGVQSPITASSQPAATSGSLTDRILAPLGMSSNSTATPVEPAAPFGRTASTSTPAAASGSTSMFGFPTTAPAAIDNSVPLRIASFNLADFDAAKRDRIFVRETLVRLLTQFDLIALQEIKSKQDNVLPELTAALNASGRRYDFLIGPRVGRGDVREQFAFIFNTDRIETDRYQMYTVDDPEDMIQFEPLVGWFRAKGVGADQAFTFSLANVHIDPNFASQEMQMIPDLMQSIAADGRQEDDVILAGDFSTDAAAWLARPELGLRTALDGIATTVHGTQAFDNFIFSAAHTSEFTGRSGAYDFLRQFNMSLEQATQVSDHLPIWIEFSPQEGGRPGQVAGRR